MKKFQVAVVGVNSIFGGTSALLLKQSPFIKCIKLYDHKNVEAAIDLCAINTQCKVKMFLGNEELENAFEDTDIIVIGDDGNEAMMSSDSHLMTAAANYRNYAKAIAQAAPHAIIVVASTPINCLLPIMSQLLVKHGCYNHNKVMGSTLIDTIRASSMLASHLNLDPKEVVLPVIGGSSERTRVPVFSQSRPYFSLKKDEKTKMIMSIRRGDVQVLANKGSPEVLNRAYSTVRFLNSIMAGLRGDANVTDITMCRTELVPGVEYFSLPVIFGKEGIFKRFGVPKTTEVEDEMVEEAIKNVKKDTDKAAYIVRGAIELPEQKYLSSNERASSQKEMFDLYVKCLPKPVDNKQDSISDYITNKESKTTTNYSFQNLIKNETSINPMAVPDNKSFRRMACNKLKNVVSEDSFLRSTGFFPSPIQNPILILEPMKCPSAPHYSNEHSESVDSEGGELENEENFILHEENLAQTSGKRDTMVSVGNSKDFNAGVRPSRKSPLSSNEMARIKTVDPIAKLRERIVDEDLNETTHVHPSHLSKLSKPPSSDANQPRINEVLDRYSQQNKSSFDESQQRGTHRSKRILEDPEEEEEFLPQNDTSAASGDENYSIEHVDPGNGFEKLVYDVRSDRAHPAYNIHNRQAPATSETGEEEDQYQETAVSNSEYHNPDKDEKYKKLVSRLFRKLDGLNSGAYLPLKSSDRSKSKCRKSFTESAVRSKSHWTSTGQMFQSKPPLKIKLAESPYDNDQEASDSNFYQKNLYFKKARKPVPAIKPFLSQSSKNTASFSPPKKPSVSEVNKKEIDESENETVHVVCPKCQNKITCQPDKIAQAEAPKKVKTFEQKLPKRSAECIAETRREPAVTKVNVTYHGPRPDSSTCFEDRAKRSGTSITVSPETLKISKDVELQEERLKRLKEKINQKLIPLLNVKSNNLSSTGSVRPLSLPDFGSNSRAQYGSSCLGSNKSPACEQGENSKESKSFVGTPFIVGKEDIISKKENTRESKNVGDKRNSETTWQGIPFVVKNNNEKSERGRKEGLIESVNVKKNCTKQMDEQVSAQCTHKPDTASKRAAKTTNKLQLLGASCETNRLTEIHKKLEEMIDSEKIIKESKQTRLKKEISDLKSVDVQNYMQARLYEKYERSQHHKTVEDKTSNENDGNTKSVTKCDNKADSSAELTNMNNKEPLGSSGIDSSTAEVRVRIQSPNQTKQTVTEVGLKPISSADSKINDPTEPKRDERKFDGNETCSSIETSDKSRVEITSPVGEVSTKSGGEQQKCVATPSSDEISTTSVEGAKLDEAKIENKSGQIPNKNDGSTDKDVGSKVLRKSLVTSKRDCHLKPNPALSMVWGPPKSANKLQLLAKARESKVNNNDKICSIDGKLETTWEETLSGKTTPALLSGKKSNFWSSKDVSSGILGKKSAAVQIAQGNNITKPPTYKVKLKAPTKTNIMEGLSFSFKKKRRKPTRNLLKELASSAAQRESIQVAEICKRPVRHGRSLDPSSQLHSCKEATKERKSLFHNFKEGTNCSSRSAEYSREEEKLAKLASEVIMKRELTRPQTVAGKWKLGGPSDKAGVRVKKRKRPNSYASVRNLRNQWTDYAVGKDSERESRIRKSADEIQSKLISMPHIRHQTEHLESPLGPMEVQPGLAVLNYGKIGSVFPSTENSWESVLFNEYVRSNLLPSLKDTRETFHLEERPS